MELVQEVRRQKGNDIACQSLSQSCFAKHSKHRSSSVTFVAKENIARSKNVDKTKCTVFDQSQ